MRENTCFEIQGHFLTFYWGHISWWKIFWDGTRELSFLATSQSAVFWDFKSMSQFEKILCPTFYHFRTASSFATWWTSLAPGSSPRSTPAGPASRWWRTSTSDKTKSHKKHCIKEFKKIFGRFHEALLKYGVKKVDIFQVMTIILSRFCYFCNFFSDQWPFWEKGHRRCGQHSLRPRKSGMTSQIKRKSLNSARRFINQSFILSLQNTIIQRRWTNTVNGAGPLSTWSEVDDDNIGAFEKLKIMATKRLGNKKSIKNNFSQHEKFKWMFQCGLSWEARLLRVGEEEAPATEK